MGQQYEIIMRPKEYKPMQQIQAIVQRDNL